MGLFGMMTSTRYVCVFREFLKTEIFNTCFDLFFALPWNNFLHTIVSRAFQIIMDCKEVDVIKQLFEVTSVHERFAKAGIQTVENHTERSSRPGYMGFVNTLTSRILRTSEEVSSVHDMLESCPEWDQYLSGDYTEMITLENKPLGGPFRSGDSSDDEDNAADQVVTFQVLVKRTFENEFPEDFAIGDLDDPELDNLLHPPFGSNYIGVAIDDDFGTEFDSD